MDAAYMTLAEIDEMYPNAWVLLTEPKVHPKTFELYGGRVVMHATTREEFDRLLPAAPGGPVFANHYTGQENPNVTYAFNR